MPTKAKTRSTQEAEEFERNCRMSMVWPSFYSMNQSKPCLEAQHNLQVICNRNKCHSEEFLVWYFNSYHDIPAHVLRITKFAGLGFTNLSNGPTMHIDALSAMCVSYYDKGLCYKYGRYRCQFGAELKRMCNFFHKQVVLCVKKELANAKTIIALANVFDVSNDIQIVKPIRINQYVNKRKTKSTSTNKAE